MGQDNGGASEVRRAIIAVLQEPGLKTQDRIIERVIERYGFQLRSVKIHLTSLISEEVVVPHPRFEDVWVVAEGIESIDADD